MIRNNGKSYSRPTSVRRFRWRRTSILVIAAGLSTLIAVDPFSLSGVSGGVAQASQIAEDRAANLADALSKLPQQSAATATPLTGSWPSGDDDGLPLLQVSLPDEDEATVPIPAAASASVNLGGMPVELTEASAGTTPESVTVRVEDPAAAQAAGVTGVLLQLVEAIEEEGEPSTEELSVDLTVSYAEFAGLVGGDWSSRLQIVHLPDCGAVSPGDPDCQPQPIPTVNDPVAQTVSATVPVNPAAPEGGFAPMSFGASAFGSLAVTAGVSSSAGDWSKTGLPHSSSWGTSGNTGAFTWSYPLDVPAPVAGPAPELALSYSSAASDGRVPSTNNQSGWIGEGFDLTSSYIERQYKPCALDEQGAANNAGRLTGDLCWGPANAVFVLNGAGSELVYDSVNEVWRSKSEDGTRAELLTGGWHSGSTGEYWKITTHDGTQYFFGRGKTSSSGPDLKSAWTVPVYGNHSGEPCYKNASNGGFASSKCSQVWRWNLDHVVDPSGNTMTYSYASESNAYVADFGNNSSWSTTSYIAGGRLAKIEYGTRADSTAEAPFRVVFDAEKRCVTDRTDGGSLCAGGQSQSDTSKWLDTPTDLQCSTSSEDCMNITPVFFDTTRLAKVTAQAWDGTAYRDIDSWAFGQRFVGEGDGGEVEYAASVTLRLESVQRTGHGGTASTADDLTLPAIQFGYMALPNRVDTVTDGASALFRHRVIAVRTESGGMVSVSYRDAECTPANLPGTSDTAQAANTKLCYLVKWQPDDASVPENHWFHKYVVESIVEDGAPRVGSGSELITGSVSTVTRYAYLGGALWAKPTGPMIDPDEVTYSEFRGVAQLDTIVGEGAEQATVGRSVYFRGTGDTLTAGPAGHTVSVLDREEFAGQVFSSQSLNGSAVLSETINHLADPVTTATGAGGMKATRIPSSTTYTFSFDASGTLEHRTSSTATNDASGLPVTINDRGDLTTTADDVCTRMEYRRDTAFTEANMLSYVSKSEAFAASCDGTLTNATLLSRDTVDYDSAGRIIENRSVDPDDPAADVVHSVMGYDGEGRPVSIQDAGGNTTTIAYTASAGGQVSQIVTTSPDPDGAGPAPAFTSTQIFDPLTGLPVSSADQNGAISTGSHDALGRLTSLRLPEHAGAAHPSVEHSYVFTPNGLNAVLTRTLGADGQRQHTSVVLYDGMGRPFQSQVEGADASASDQGRMVSHVYYDSVGRMVRQTSPWWAEGAPSTTPIVPIAVPPSQASYVYDDAGRVTDAVLWRGSDSNPANELLRTKTFYDGATTLTIPPIGGVPVETITDAYGRVIEMREYMRDPDTQASAVTPAAVRALTMQPTGYEYDSASQLVKMTNPEGDEWLFEYDLAGRQISATDPDSGTSTTVYDQLGQVSSRTNANGDTLAYTYDALGRITSLHDNSSSGTVRASWAYDSATLPGGSPALGQLSAATRFLDGKEYRTAYPAYDIAYRPTQIDTILPEDEALHSLTGAVFSTALAYTADGQLAQITYPKVTDGALVVLGSETVTTRFDDASMPAWMSGGFGWGTYVADSRWTADGKPLLQDLGNTYGTAVSFAWDEATQRLAGVRLDRERVEGTELELSYGYDAAGNVTSIFDAPTNAAVAGQRDAQCFEYDGLRRLEAAWTTTAMDCATPASLATVGGVSPYWNEYSYDALGNRTQLTEHIGSAAKTTAYTHGAGAAGPHQLTSMTVTTGSTSVTTGFTWDAAGNQVSRTKDAELQTQLWDAEGELVAVTGGGADVANVFDANGGRLIRKDASSVTVYLPGGQEVRATDTATTAMRSYQFAGAVVAIRTSSGLSGVTSIVTDHHGTPLAYVHNTDWASGVSRLRSDPFGATRPGSMDPLGERGFLGATVDQAGQAELVLLGARFYDPSTGTFLSVDPMLDPGMPAQFNAYVYSGNNPMTWSDPTGLNWFADLWNGAVKFVNKYKADIAGFIVGTLVTAACMASTLGIGSVACLAAGGAAGSATTNVVKQVESGKPFSWTSLISDTVSGAAMGVIGGPIAKGAQKLLAPVANKIAKGVQNVFRPKATAPTVRPGASPGVSPKGGAASGGGARPAVAGKPAPGKPAAGKPGASGKCSVNSFVPGTLVLLADGSRVPIEELAWGDLVLTADPVTGELTVQPVVATITGSGEKALVIVTIDDADGGSGSVTATAGHPFWVPDIAEWVEAGQLLPGMWLQTSAGTWVQVSAVEHERREQVVHNLTVGASHTFFVYAGEHALLNHNCAPGNGGAGPVRVGQAGEDAVRAAHDIGPKFGTRINGRNRIFDGLNSQAVSEVKNVARLSYTQQLRDYTAFAAENGLRLDIYVRAGTRLSGPLKDAFANMKNPINIIEFLS